MASNIHRLKLGDHIFVSRGAYTHHGIYAGGETVIHYTGEVFRKVNASVAETSLAVFAEDGVVEVRAYAGDTYSRQVIVDRARARLGEQGYHLVFNNCEHFARWCVVGDHRSEQVRDAVAAAAGVSGSAAATAAGLGTAAATGAVAGLSGAGVMSGLASVGGVVGGGALAGVGVLAAGPAVVSAVAMQHVLADDPTLPADERAARAAGRTASVAGAVGATGASVAAVTAMGAAGATGGAAITSGLAALGGIVGGGMVSGVAVAVAAPAAVAAGVGYGVYRAWKRLSS